MNLLWLDCETTGFSPQKNGLIQVAGVITVDGEEVDRFDLKARPFQTDNIQQAALNVSGTTMEDLLSYPDPRETLEDFIEILDRWIDPEDPEEFLIPCGFKVGFDVRFMKAFFEKCHSPMFGNYITEEPIFDIHPLAKNYFVGKEEKPENYKLSTLADWFELDFKAHDAFEDITISMDIFQIIANEEADEC